MGGEQEIHGRSGWAMLPMVILGCLAGPALIVLAAVGEHHRWWGGGGVALLVITGILVLASSILAAIGFLVLQPNEAGVLVLFGRYVGSVKRNGFFWVNPFTTKRKLSMRRHNLNGERLKVNDRAGNPIEIAAVVVWRVEDTFAACFEVENYQDYVETQSESALRHLASSYPYDSWEEDEQSAEITLRGDIDQVSAALERELQERLARAGVHVDEARLSHLAYASEIAGAMLQRQQASAIIAARRKIVEGAVGMVQMALQQLSDEKVVELDDERRAAMVSNLLVVLCGDRDAHPVINAGSLY
jgi:regulator of protease activity HflC (stomatin/prohibitin superfamily)